LQGLLDIYISLNSEANTESFMVKKVANGMNCRLFYLFYFCISYKANSIYYVLSNYWSILSGRNICHAHVKQPFSVKWFFV